MRLTYKKSGVDIKLASNIIENSKNIIASTFSKNVFSHIGKFSGFYKISSDLILVASIDGVGTKIKIAQLAGEYTCIGEDIVNHCVNDVAVHNATPVFFLDYIAMEKLQKKVFLQIIEGMAKACRENKISLIGGETAEMPKIYYKNMFDVAGCIVGIVKKKDIIDGKNIIQGDVVLAVASNGLHTNGFSLVNKLFFEIKKYKINQYFSELSSTLKEALLKPHPSYLPLIQTFTKKFKIKGIAHITGGGIIDNLSRIIPDGLCAEIEKEKIDVLPIFKFIQKVGNIAEEEMFKTFNMGVGLIIITENKNFTTILKEAYKIGYNVYPVGRIIKKKTKKVVIK